MVPYVKGKTGIVYSYGKETIKIQFKKKISGNIPVKNVKLVKTNKKNLIRLRKSEKVCNIVGSALERPKWETHGEISGILNQERIGQLVVQSVKTVLKNTALAGPISSYRVCHSKCNLIFLFFCPIN